MHFKSDPKEVSTDIFKICNCMEHVCTCLGIPEDPVGRVRHIYLKKPVNIKTILLDTQGTFFIKIQQIRQRFFHETLFTCRFRFRILEEDGVVSKKFGYFRKRIYDDE